MNKNCKQKMMKRTVITIFALMFCVFSFMLLPINFASADSNGLSNDYESFNKALMQMLNEHDDWNREESYILNAEDFRVEEDEVFVRAETIDECGLEKCKETGYIPIRNLKTVNNISVEIENEKLVIEKEPEINRLIVTSDRKIDSFGASARAEFQSYHIFQYKDAESAAKAYDYYSELSVVDSVSYDNVISANSEVVESDATYTYKSWGASYVGFSNYTSTMLEINSLSELPTLVVAVLDSGIYTSHELFSGRILHAFGKDFSGEISTTSYEYEDLNGHGTHVSGTIAESTLSNVKILPLKVLQANGKGLVSMIVNAINYAVQLKQGGLNLKVMNMSVGVEGSSSSNSSLTNAVIKAYNNGIMPVVSAGNGDNNGVRIDVTNSSPANVDCAITVAALVQKTSFPSGKVLYYDTYSNYGKYIDFAAPGTAITSASIYSPTYYVSMSGTSMAAPHVSASVALLFSNPVYSDCSLSEIYDLLKNNSVDMGNTGWDQDYGWGLVNISNIGVVVGGEVVFSSREQFPTSSFQLSLSYESSNTVKIYYSTDEKASVIDTTATLYTGAITISKTTKVTAAAFIYNGSGVLIQKSDSASFTYYFGNTDLTSNFEFDTYSNQLVISKYNGILTTLNVPQMINSQKVIGIGNLAFKNTNIEILNLPSSVYLFYDSAFYGCTTLKEIHCASSSEIQIGNYAFRDCSKLSVFDVSEISTIGQYAFVSCSSLQEMNLPFVTSIGMHAFTKSGIRTVFIGKNITSIGNQTDLSISKLHGYAGTAAESFAENYDIDFVDLSLNISKNFSNRIVVKANQVCNLSLEFEGCDVTYDIVFSGQSTSLSHSVENLSDFRKKLEITLSNLSVGEYTLSVLLSDAYQSSKISNIISIEVVNSGVETFEVDFEEGDFLVYIDGSLASSGDLLFYGFEYEVEIFAKEGFNLNKIVVNGVTKNINETYLVVATSNLNLSVQTSAKSSLSVVFDTGDKGYIIVQNEAVANSVVARNDNLIFSVVPYEGYSVKRVIANGIALSLNEDGFYHISNIVSDVEVSINFIEAYYTILIALGKGGNLSIAGGSTDSVAHGSSRTFVVSASEGYDVDFVSVNGILIRLSNNKFSLENIGEDYEIVVSFKKQGSLFSENSMALTYFIIFLAIFAVFVVAKVALYISRKEKERLK